MNDTRVCYECKQQKPLNEFKKDKNNKTGHGYICRICDKVQHYERRQKKKQEEYTQGLSHNIKIGRIYKIISSESNSCYIGSTFQNIEDRFKNHKEKYSTYQKGFRVNFFTSFVLFEEYGTENCKIEIIKEYQVIDKKHLEVYESLWINKLKQNSVNLKTPFSLNSISKKMYQKLYYETYKMKNQTIFYKSKIEKKIQNNNDN